MLDYFIGQESTLPRTAQSKPIPSQYCPTDRRIHDSVQDQPVFPPKFEAYWTEEAKATVCGQLQNYKGSRRTRPNIAYESLDSLALNCSFRFPFM